MDFHMSLFHLLGMKFRPHKLNSMAFMEHLQKFNLDLFIPRYGNSPQVSFLGMNPGRGQNPNLEGSYLLEYRKYEAEFWKKCTLGLYIRPLKVSSPEPFSIMGYSECTKTQHFQYLGFFQLGVKLGFDFPRVPPIKFLDLGL